jgi:hypothetical protein
LLFVGVAASLAALPVPAAAAGERALAGAAARVIQAAAAELVDALA